MCKGCACDQNKHLSFTINSKPLTGRVCACLSWIYSYCSFSHSITPLYPTFRLSVSGRLSSHSSGHWSRTCGVPLVSATAVWGLHRSWVFWILSGIAWLRKSRALSWLSTLSSCCQVRLLSLTWLVFRWVVSFKVPSNANTQGIPAEHCIVTDKYC